MTKKLFYEDSHMQKFTARVLQCVQEDGDFQILLDQTAFFPEGGGQYADTGILEVLQNISVGREQTKSAGPAKDLSGEQEVQASGTGKVIQVLDVQEADGQVWHRTDGAVSEGDLVCGTIHWQERFMKMQQHTGEHIVSGLVNADFGYQNVGFHLGSEDCTMDFNGEITRKELLQIEQRANQAVAENLPVQASCPSGEELMTLKYRSKKEVDGQLRIVTIPGYDVCACCAPHVKRTGEIGLIKLTNVQRYKGGARVTMLCGFRALADYEKKAAAARAISAALCAKEDEIAEAVDRLKEECAQYKQRLAEQQKTILSYKAKEAGSQGDVVCFFESGLEGEAPRLLMNLALEQGHAVCAVFCENGQDGYRYVIGSHTCDMRALGKEINAAFAGRGGGKPEMIQGSLKGKEEELRAWIQEKARNGNDE